MAVLLLRLAAPLQSWGVDSKFETRRTENYPTKSGVVGLLAAALGRKRGEALDDLCALKFGIRIEHEGTIIRDYHTVKTKVKGKDNSYITNRYYLSDAVFLAGFESDNVKFLKDIEDALYHPVFPLFLGRRACPPTLPLCLGIKDGALIENLRRHDWLVSEQRQKKAKEDERWLRIIADSSEQGVHIRDLPISYSSVYRKFSWRIANEYDPVWKSDFENTEHDAMSELE